jgi:hypothetical protein
MTFTKASCQSIHPEYIANCAHTPKSSQRRARQRTVAVRAAERSRQAANPTRIVVSVQSGATRAAGMAVRRPWKVPPARLPKAVAANASPHSATDRLFVRRATACSRHAKTAQSAPSA